MMLWVIHCNSYYTSIEDKQEGVKNIQQKLLQSILEHNWVSNSRPGLTGDTLPCPMPKLTDADATLFNISSMQI